MKITKTQPNRSAIDQSRLRWDFLKQGNPPAIKLIAERVRSQWDWCNPGTIGQSTEQSKENWEILVQSEIKPNLTAVGQVWALTEGQTKTGAWGPFAILSVPRNPRNELFWVFAIPLQSRPPYLQSARLWLDSGFLAILMQFRRIAVLILIY